MCLRMNIFFFILTLRISLSQGVIMPFDTQKCATDYDNIDIVMPQIILECKDLPAIPPLRAQYDTLWTGIDFKSGNITDIFNNSLPSELTSLGFYGHPLTNIADDAFQSLADTLQILTFASAKFTQLPNALLIITKLISLTIVDTKIQYWDLNIMEHIGASLEYLELRNVGLSSWPSWISFFHNLYKLNISDNAVQYVPKDAFNSMNNTLEIVSLKQCGLTILPTALSVLVWLKKLDLSYNKIIDVDQIEQLATFSCSKTLYTLTLESNGLTALPNLSNVLSLDTINLAYNKISNLTTGSFPHSLDTLLLQHNQLPAVPSDIANVLGLEFLNLSYNQITVINIDMFPRFLRKLDLSNNKIVEITNAQKDYSMIKILHLESNPISVISPSAFDSLQYLSVLNLDNTDLTQIPIAIASLTTLEVLTMKNTPITCLYPPPWELVHWYKLFKGNFSHDQFCPQEEITHYLSYWLQLTEPTTLAITTTTCTSGAPNFICILCSRYPFFFFHLFLVFVVSNKYLIFLPENYY